MSQTLKCRTPSVPLRRSSFSVGPTTAARILPSLTSELFLCTLYIVNAILYFSYTYLNPHVSLFKGFFRKTRFVSETFFQNVPSRSRFPQQPVRNKKTPPVTAGGSIHVRLSAADQYSSISLIVQGISCWVLTFVSSTTRSKQLATIFPL